MLDQSRLILKSVEVLLYDKKLGVVVLNGFKTALSPASIPEDLTKPWVAIYAPDELLSYCAKWTSDNGFIGEFK